ncbi:HET-domain-containing protein, partial [Lepidopterella palustris CBS 459.81]
MRLLNTTTVQLKKFPAKEIPKYAILSHTWEADEVSLQDMSQPDHDVALSGKAGYEKIKTCCHLAQKDGYDWVWIDTCCIDKTSSSELSEEINSMYQWYKRACVCYAYLADLAAFTSDNTANKSGLWESRWFRRGWTLQELIAPEFVEFYAKDWSEIGTKSSLEPWIAEITGINVYVLRGVSPSVFSIFERMTWAKYRETTREEDMAYCLLGIFQINMPLLYGEGKKAFKRLQYELLQHHDDLTILAW